MQFLLSKSMIKSQFMNSKALGIYKQRQREKARRERLKENEKEKRLQFAAAVDRISKAIRVNRLDLVEADLQLIMANWRPRRLWPCLYRQKLAGGVERHSGGFRELHVLSCGHQFKTGKRCSYKYFKNGLVRCRICEVESYVHVERHRENLTKA